MKSAKESSPNKTTLVMNGHLTISRAHTAKDELQKNLKKVQHLELDMESAEEIDLSFLQLLCSAHRTSINLKKTLTFKGKLPETFKQSLKDNGFMRQKGCTMDSANTCLWIMK